MKKYFILIPVVICLVFVSACSNNEEEDLRKKEREKIDEFLKSTKIDFYKAIKIALRSSAEVGKNPEFDKARQSLLQIGGEVISVGVEALDTSKKVHLNPMELLSLASDLYKAKDVLLKTDEDSLPTILGNIYYVFSEKSSSVVPPLMGYTYDNNLEHGLVGILWFLSVKAPKEFTFYELDKTNEDKFSIYEAVLAFKLAKSLIYYQENFNWVGMDKSSEYLTICEKNKEDIMKNPVWTSEDLKISGEQNYYQMHAMGLLMRGLNERKLEKEKESMQDFEQFLTEAEKGGLDNELTWSMGSYVSIKNEDKEKSLLYLNKLEKSELLDTPEKDAIKEIKTYVEKRDKGAALTKLNDKMQIGKIAIKLIGARLEKAKALKELENSNQGKHFLKLHKQLNEKAQYIDKIEGNMNTDSLGTKATDLVKGIFGK